MGPPPTASASSKLAAGAAASHEDLTPMEVFRKALTPNGRWNKFYDVLYWFRQALAILVGFVWGRAGSRGAPAIISFVGLNVMLPRMYYAQYARVDEDDFDPLSLMKEGFQPSFGLFMFTWIVAYNFFHGEKLLEAAAAAVAGGGK